MADAHKNFAYSTVATAPSPATSGTSLTVAAGDGSKFPAPPFNITLWPTNVAPTTANAEIVRVTAVATDTFTISRAQESTSAMSVATGYQVSASITRKTLVDLEDSQVTVFNVKGPTFGAKGDGTTDDYTAIQAAITAAQAVGGEVFLPIGTYLLGTTLTISADNITICGAGWGSVLKNAAGTNQYAITIENSVIRKSLVFRDFRIDGNRASQTTGGGGITGPAANSTIDRLWIGTCYTVGLNLTGTAGGATWAFSNDITRCLFDTGTPTAIQMANNDENTISRNVFNDITTACISETSGTHIITNNVFVGGPSTTTGIGINCNSVSTTIANNQFDGIHEENIKLAGDNYHVVGNRFSKVTGGTAGKSVIRITSGSNSIVTSNHVTGGAYYTYAFDDTGANYTRLGDNFWEAGTSGQQNLSSNSISIYGTDGKVGIKTTNPTEALDIIGNFQIKDADTPTKAHRWRTISGDIDVEASGHDVYYSVWDNADYTGTQRYKLRLIHGSDYVTAIGTWLFSDSPFGANNVIINGATGTITAVGALAAAGATLSNELDVQYDYPLFKVKNTNASQFAGAGFYLINTTSTMANQAGVSHYMGINDSGATQGFYAIDKTNVSGGGTGHLMLFDYNANTTTLYNTLNVPAIAATGAVTSTGGGVGYATGAGGTVTQATSKATAVTLNKLTGEITLNAAALAAATIVTFQLNNSTLAVGDMLVVSHQATGTFGAYTINARVSAAGTASIAVRNNSAASLSEAIVVKFAVVKAVTA